MWLGRRFLQETGEPFELRITKYYAQLEKTNRYEVINEEGPDHNKKFTIVVKINNKVIGKGVGKSKQKAQEQAALSGIKYLEKEN
jgi:ribonuclease-3